ncbi:MAG: transglycosylase SLT domain-containing protein [Pseudomonadota bacterium]
MKKYFMLLIIFCLCFLFSCSSKRKLSSDDIFKTYWEDRGYFDVNPPIESTEEIIKHNELRKLVEIIKPLSESLDPNEQFIYALILKKIGAKDVEYIDIFKKIKAEDVLFLDLIYHYLGVYHLEKKEYNLAYSFFSLLLEKCKNSSLFYETSFTIADIFLKLEQIDAAIKILEDLLILEDGMSETKSREIQIKVFSKLLHIYKKNPKENSDLIIAIYTNIFRQDPACFVSKIKLENYDNLPKDIIEFLKEDEKIADIYFENREYQNAISYYERAEKKISKKDCAIKRELIKKIVKSYKMLFDINKQLEWIGKINKTCPDIQSYEWEALIYLKQKADLKAIEVLKKAYNEFPEMPLTSELLYLIGRTYLIMGKWEDAAFYFNKVISEFGMSSFYEISRYRLGLIELIKRRFDYALYHFKMLFDSKDIYTNFGSKYWASISLLHLSRGYEAYFLIDEIIKKDPFNYYSLLCNKYGLASYDLNLKDGFKTNKFIRDFSKLKPEDRFYLKRGKYFLNSGFFTEAQKEFRELSFRYTRNLSFTEYFALLAYNARDYNYAFRIIDPWNWSEFWTYLQFPRAYWQDVYLSSRKYNIDSFLVLSIMRQESTFKKESYSQAAAIGLMQLTSPTALKMADKKLSLDELQDTENNIKFASKYLSKLSNDFKSNLNYIIPAYNAGEDLVFHWKKGLSFVDNDLFVELIPYGETRQYTRKVLSNYYTYKNLYKDFYTNK